MFHNVGGKIKALAVGIFVLESLAAILAGMGIYIEADDGAFWIGTLVIVGGILAAYVSVLLIYGFGELIENSAVSREELREIRLGLSLQSTPQNSETAHPGSQPAVPSASRPSVRPDDRPAVRPASTAKVPLPGKDGQIICPICGTEQRAGRTACFHCRQLFR